jgi:hypothetical protein
MGWAATQVYSWVLLVFAGLLEIGWAMGVNMLSFYPLLTIRIYDCRYGTNHVFARFGGEKTTNPNGHRGLTEIGAVGTASMGILISRESRLAPANLVWLNRCRRSRSQSGQRASSAEMLNCEPLHAFRATIYGKHLIRNTLNTRFYKFK